MPADKDFQSLRETAEKEHRGEKPMTEGDRLGAELRAQRIRNLEEQPPTEEPREEAA